jgi:UDP-N-acetylglucosamine:LPS N-acetylglucosamine transferase
MPQRPPRILILTAAIGEGHDLPARVLAADLRAASPGAEVAIVDSVDDMGRLVKSIIETFTRFMVERANWLWDAVFWMITFFPPTRWVFGWLSMVLGARAPMDLIAEYDPDVVVSTYPGTSDLLGRLRLMGRLKRPVVSAITDLSALRYWSHPGVDLHLITHPESAAEVAGIIGRRDGIHPVRGLYRNEFTVPRDAVAARRDLDLPAGAAIVVVSGGGWAVGDLEGAVRVALDRPDAFAVCLCGRNESVRERIAAKFAGDPRVRAVGFTEQMSDYLAAADVLIHSTAGLTVLEALIRGANVISYGWGVAHIRVNNRAFAHFGLAQVATTRAELGDALDRALAEPRAPDGSFAELPTAASYVLGAVPRWRLERP